MMQAMNFRGWLPLTLLVAVSPAAADTEKTLAGRWSASTARTTWSIESWGDACGPRPGSESEPGGVVTISMHGKELRIDGAGRSYSTASCWESIPGQRVTSHGASIRAWRTICQSAAGDPRLVSITTTLNATDDHIEFEESGRYEFTIDGQVCRAARRRVRSYSLVERDGESRPAPESPPVAVEHPVPPHETLEKPAPEHASANCNVPGAPARLEVSPSRKLLRAGDEFTFRVRVLDRAGCPLERAVTWKVTQSNTTVDVSATGLVRVAKEAKEGSATFVIAAQDRSVQVTVDVVSEQRYQELLRAGTFDNRGETQEVAVATTTSADLGTKVAVLEDKARGRRLIFVSIIGLIALGLGAAALWLSLGRKQRNATAKPPTSSPPRNAVLLHEPLVCPTCQQEYPAGTKYCATDGNRLAPRSGAVGEEDWAASGGVCPVCGQGFDPGVLACPIHDEELVPPGAIATQKQSPSPASRRICPICGTIYASEHQFCGNDGAALVPIN
jgi:hypothetical protein